MLQFPQIGMKKNPKWKFVDNLNDLKIGVGRRFKCKTNSEWQKKKALLYPEDGIWPITIYSGLKNTIKFYLDTKETG